MCGIVGFTNYNFNLGLEEAKKILTNMNNKLQKRGPDEQGSYIQEKVYLGQRRLIVIDAKGRKATNGM